MAALAVLMTTACSEGNKGNIQAAASDSPFIHHAEIMPVDQAGDQEKMPEMTKEGLDKELVCMVNNAYMGKKQFPVEFENKLYFGCCEMCVNTIQNDPKVRVAKDPLTGKEVDKSEAFIALNPGNAYGGVFYFESEANYLKFAKL